jgi:hypothetical protein
MFKWACMIHLDTWNTSYDQKKGGNQIAIKSQELTQFLFM